MHKFYIINFCKGGFFLITQTTFSTLLIQLISESGKSTRKIALEIQEQLKDDSSQLTLSYPAFISYRNFTTVPSFEKASLIINYFNYEISNEELTEILDYSRSELKKIKLDDDKDIRQGIRLNPKNFNEEWSAAELEITIKQRIEELYGEDKGSINSYISDLIKKDLEKAGYIS